MSKIQLLSLILLILFVVLIGTINIFLINIAPRYKVKLSHWVWAPLTVALFMETKDKYVNSILPVFFLLFFIFAIIFAISYSLTFHSFNYRRFIKQIRRILNFLLLWWYLIFFVIGLIVK
ncbi:DUF3397 family protein [Xylocopilactobacillus apicola]|uniref:DUF3397 domain-containing protein n=1 Tax=Xylocopilactobacillus apicola TaxID=2932184 RepID=A0AAU9DSN4_9LACO|nr:hypothetical protein XA3_07390 [Xylocopilactobacillus apicola]